MAMCKTCGRKYAGGRCTYCNNKDSLLDIGSGIRKLGGLADR